MFARVLLALDEDVISLEIPRSDAGSRRSMAFKDAMRERDVSAVVSATIGLVVTHWSKNPETAGAMLTSLQRYVDWVDISLIVTPDFMELLRQLLQGLVSGLCLWLQQLVLILRHQLSLFQAHQHLWLALHYGRCCRDTTCATLRCVCDICHSVVCTE